MGFAAMMVLAFALDALIGWPDWLYRRIGHPVTWIGGLIAGLDRRLNHGEAGNRRVAGAITVAMVVIFAAGPAAMLQWVLPSGVPGIVLGAVLAWPWLAARSLYDHVAKVADPLEKGDLAAARGAVSMIVGRDPDTLDEAGVARSAVESLAENTSDGVMAPLFWGVIAGLPGIVAYKAVNTLDSMIGHRNDRYEDFGKVAARLDDLVNLLPARLTGWLFALASGRPKPSVRVMRADAPRHRSPNAGWPEAAIAGALSVRLSGPRVYADRVAEEPWVNAGAPDPDASSIRAALVLFFRTMVLCGACLLALAVV